MSLAKLEPRFKELLYRCLEEIRATKAALYLAEGDETYKAVTQYGFREGLPDKHQSRDDLVNNLIMKRGAFYLNNLTEDMRFSELLYDAGTSRLLVAPIYSRGKLVGFLDIRDKAGDQPFTPKDVRSSQAIADAYLDLFAEEGLFGQKKIQVSEMGQSSEGGDDEIWMLPVVERAKTELQKGKTRSSGRIEPIDPARLDVARTMLGLFLGLRGVVAAGLADLSPTILTYYMVARGPISPEAVSDIQKRLGTWMQKRGGDLAPLKVQQDPWIGNGGSPVVPGDIASLMAAPLREFGELVLSVAFSQTPGRDVRSLLERLHKCVEESVSNAVAAHSRTPLMRNVALRLIEPDLESLPDLVDHSERVASMAAELAGKAGLGSEEIERIRLAGMVHDVGMRPLGWERIQRKGQLSDSEMILVRQHPMVGAAIISRSPLGAEIATLVHSHHERVDGTGYPEGLKGKEIPTGSRIIHICEAFDAMTAPDSYKPPVSVEEACSRLSGAKGRQFDSDLVDAFVSLRT
ncbi:MAG: HD domain-containing protein [Acidobacteria bacterium]|nr:HD domain-containing protein [Acidobacteriota bacterium]